MYTARVFVCNLPARVLSAEPFGPFLICTTCGWMIITARTSGCCSGRRSSWTGWRHCVRSQPLPQTPSNRPANPAHLLFHKPPSTRHLALESRPKASDSFHWRGARRNRRALWGHSGTGENFTSHCKVRSRHRAPRCIEDRRPNHAPPVNVDVRFVSVVLPDFFPSSYVPTPTAKVLRPRSRRNQNTRARKKSCRL
jgi:hypothetical protein